jgi:hypothetical protein
MYTLLLDTLHLHLHTGFGFSLELPREGGESTVCPYFHSSPAHYDGPYRLHPALQYSSPGKQAHTITLELYSSSYCSSKCIL